MTPIMTVWKSGISKADKKSSEEKPLLQENARHGRPRPADRLSKPYASGVGFGVGSGVASGVGSGVGALWAGAPANRLSCVSTVASPEG